MTLQCQHRNQIPVDSQYDENDSSDDNGDITREQSSKKNLDHVCVCALHIFYFIEYITPGAICTFLFLDI